MRLNECEKGEFFMSEISGVVPAVRNLKDFERALQTKSEWIVLLEIRLGQLKSVVEHAKRVNKKVLLHIDLVHGLKADEYGVEFLVNEVKVDGIVSTRGSVMELAKKRRVLAIQRMFLLDSLSLKTEVRLGQRYLPNYIEVLPGKLPDEIKEISEQTNVPIIAGGLINNQEDVDNALKAGAVAVSTSEKELWSFS